MGRGKKATRKFEKNHLTDTLSRRKDFAKIKQRHQLNDKKKDRKAKNAPDEDEAEAAAEIAAKKATGNKKAVLKGSTGHNEKDLFGDMSVDDFFGGGFAIADAEAPKEKKGKVVKDVTGKRKRDEKPNEEWSGFDEGEGGDSSDSDDVPNDPVLNDEDDEDEGDDFDTHKGDLEGLKDKDPEFYKYLKENDSELLDFEEGDLDEVLELSEDEEPTKTKKKGKKATEEEEEEEEEETVDTDLTTVLVRKWKAAIIEQNSLRAMREVVLAFRAAAHVNEDDGKEYKYSISDPEVYNELLILALKHVPDVLSHHLPIKESASGKV
jgi:nucleolar complex protein 2